MSGIRGDSDYGIVMYCFVEISAVKNSGRPSLPEELTGRSAVMWPTFVPTCQNVTWKTRCIH